MSSMGFKEKGYLYCNDGDENKIFDMFAQAEYFQQLNSLQINLQSPQNFILRKALSNGEKMKVRQVCKQSTTRLSSRSEYILIGVTVNKKEMEYSRAN